MAFSREERVQWVGGLVRGVATAGALVFRLSSSWWDGRGRRQGIARAGRRDSLGTQHLVARDGITKSRTKKNI
jgi:hypothetical protein